MVLDDIVCNNLTATCTALGVEHTETFIEKNMIPVIEQAIPPPPEATPHTFYDAGPGE